jgi:exopolysaccharide biosynthesis WecB/TagA/CpsF family protein
LAKRLQERFPNLILVGYEPSTFRTLNTSEKSALVKRIRDSGASLTLVGLGCPRQEVWVYEYRDALAMPLIAVGAAFDFLAGLMQEAPPLLQRAGLEWAYRLYREPRRLWRRYVYLNPMYLGHLLLQATGLRRYDPGDALRPGADLGYG